MDVQDQAATNGMKISIWDVSVEYLNSGSEAMDHINTLFGSCALEAEADG